MGKRKKETEQRQEEAICVLNEKVLGDRFDFLKRGHKKKQVLNLPVVE